MGIVESTWRKQVRVGQEVDVTLIGGREMRGRVLEMAEDGLLLDQGDVQRPIAFAGIATFAPAHRGFVPARPHPAPQAEGPHPAEVPHPAGVPHPAEALRPAESPLPAEVLLSAEVPHPAEGPHPAEVPLPTEGLRPEEAQAEEEREAEGWLDRYEQGAGSVALLDGTRLLFQEKGTELDEALRDKIALWTGRALPVTARVRGQGRLMRAAALHLRETEDAYRAQGESWDEEGARDGFGEIVHYDKINGYGKAREGAVKFLFKRGDIASDGLWQEILRSNNTCGIKVAFTARRDGKSVRYGRLREIAALFDDGSLTPPDFSRPIPGQAESEPAAPAPAGDRNPLARVYFTDGTTMEDVVRTGALMFYNADKYFGRLRTENGERYYFRASDVMQQSLLDFLNTRSSLDIEETLVNFSIKRLPTGKLAAGRVTWPEKSGGKPQAEAAAERKEESAPAQTAAAEEAEPVSSKGKAELNAYCAAYLKAWGGEEAALRAHLGTRAEEARRRDDLRLMSDLLLERAALSDARREKRDEAMWDYLRPLAEEDAGEDLASFLRQAVYSGVKMFDAMTELFAVADGAIGRICGILAAGDGLVTLRAEMLRRFGQVPGTAQVLRAAWQPLVEAQRAKEEYAALPLSEEGLRAVDPEGRETEWAEALRALQEKDGAALQRARENLMRRPYRAAVEWLLPHILQAQSELAHAGGANVEAQGLCSLSVCGKTYAVLELSGAGKELCCRVGDALCDLEELSGSVRLAFPVEGEAAEREVRVSGLSNGTQVEICKTAAFPLQKRAQSDPAALVFEKRAVAFVASPEALEAVRRGAEEKKGCIVVDAGDFDSGEGAEERLTQALQAELEQRFGAEVAGLLSFPRAGEKAEPGALERALRDFADVCLLHDGLKGASLLFLLRAFGEAAEPLCRLCAKLTQMDVCAALAMEEEVADAPVFVALGGEKGLAQALHEAGFAAEPLMLASCAPDEEQAEEEAEETEEAGDADAQDEEAREA